MGHSAFPPEHELYLDSLGMHGAQYANVAVNEVDLVLALGVRFDDRVTGNVDAFIREGKIIHVDIDRDELNENKTVTLPVCADVAMVLQQLCDRVVSGENVACMEYLHSLKREYPYPIPRTGASARSHRREDRLPGTPGHRYRRRWFTQYDDS